MTNAARDTFVMGLRNAHAMEIQARELMERQSERLDEYPEVKAKLTAHLHETNEQLKRLERCLDACGESTSSLKDTTQSVMANMQAMAHAAAGDEILKNAFANNAFENFEIAAYKSLIALCDSAGAPERQGGPRDFPQGGAAHGGLDRLQRREGHQGVCRTSAPGRLTFSNATSPAPLFGAGLILSCLNRLVRV
ncbi:ferritin-like metal-binding protein YciE [Bradyrhizobium sp. i1.3.6]